MADETRKETEGHPLPASREARGDELPEHLIADKGLGEDQVERVQSTDDLVNPDGEPYTDPGEQGNC